VSGGQADGPMRYVSTRGGMDPQPFLDVLLEGLAPDGGLVVPQSYPRLSPQDLDALRPLNYVELAIAIIGRFADDVPAEVLRRIIEATYTEAAFGSPDITPVVHLEENLHLLRLSNGPSLAFKDVALQFLGHLYPWVLEQRNEELNILGATSGDTGGAAIEAMRGKARLRVFMLSPKGRTSAFQAAQMYSVLDDNIFNIVVDGVFDDCQDIVKAVGEDAEFKAQYRIGTVNSINWARIVAQVVYYFKAYFAVTATNAERVSFAVPSGNFGNIFAGHVAKKMGLPIHRLILATNENDVLDEFFRTGVYAPRNSAAVSATSSPSMDISKASNFERYLYDLSGADANWVRESYARIAQGGRVELDSELRRRMGDSGFESGSNTHEGRVEVIRTLHQATGLTVDPHTADGLAVARPFALAEPDVAMVCLETALPAKFASTIVEALGVEPDRPASTVGIEKREQRTHSVGVDVAAVEEYIGSIVG
jgi:threonine synthase